MSISEAAKRAGVNRRTIQRWLKKGGILSKDERGRVSLEDVRTCVMKREVGRKSDGERFNIFWDDRNLTRATFCTKVGLQDLIKFLGTIAVIQTERGRNAEYIASLEQAIASARTADRLKKEKPQFWQMILDELQSGIPSVRNKS